jgi:thioredoxin-like negative regulator of GroEL
LSRLDAAIAATGGKVHLAVVDIDELSDLAMDSGIEAVPTVIAFKGGQPVDRFVGLLDEDRLGAFVQKLYTE